MNPFPMTETLGIGGIEDLYPKAEADVKAVDSEKTETEGGGA